MTGWISVHRKIQDHWLWEDKPFSKGQAWIDILLMANHRDNKFLLGNTLIEVERGSLVTSQSKLMERWGWGNTKVRNFLKLLKEENMIEYSGKKFTLIKIKNYETYQKQTDNNQVISTDSWNMQTDSKLTTNCEQTVSKLTANTNNNDNNDNKYSICMYSEKLKEIVSLLERNIGVIPPILVGEISEYSNIFSVDMFSEAIKIASNNKKRTVNYVLGILRNWQDNNILTIDDLVALRKEKEIEIKKEKQTQPKIKTRFHNFEQRTSKYSPEELEKIIRKNFEEKMKKKKLDLSSL